jgi:YD repeat-containing protein
MFFSASTPGGSGGQQGEYVYNTYNSQGLVYSVYGDDTYVSSTDYDAAGRVDLRTLGNGRRTDYVYYNWTDVNGLGRVKYIKTGTTSSPTSLQYMYYVYDAVGNVTQIKDYNAGGTQTQSFTYDALDRLKPPSPAEAVGARTAKRTTTITPLAISRPEAIWAATPTTRPSQQVDVLLEPRRPNLTLSGRQAVTRTSTIVMVTRRSVPSAAVTPTT